MFAKLFLFILVIEVNSLYLPVDNPGLKNSTAEEIQHAICKISSKDLEATANATIFRELRGVCTSAELQTYFNRLELTFSQEIKNLKDILQENGFKISEFPKKIISIEQDHPDLGLSFTTIPNHQSVISSKPNQPEVKSLSNKIRFEEPNKKILNIPNQSMIISNTLDEQQIIQKSYEEEASVRRSVDEPTIFKHKDSFERDADLERDHEISKYNNSVVDSNKGGIYFYYWKIHNIKELLLRKEMYKSSPEFFVLGHGLHLQLYPNYVEGETFALHLGASTKGFIKKHKIYILNLVDKSMDISSGLMFGFRGEESMFKILESIVKESGYIRNNCMIVKLEILLNS